MAVIIYRGKSIIPGGLLSFSKSYQFTGDGEKIGSVFNITLQGTLVAFKGSPDGTGAFWTSSGYPPDETPDEDERLKAILTKQEALRQLFAVDGGLFEVTPWDGSSPLQFNPRIKQIEFPEGIWFDRSEYSIQMEADLIQGLINPSGEDAFNDYISEADEQWSLEFNEKAQGIDHPNTYVLTHTLEAVGKRFYNENGDLVKPAWEQARQWVQPRLGLDSQRLSSSGILNLPSYYQGYNHSLGETVGENNGRYSVTESWILSSGAALEDFSIQVQASRDNGRTTVTIDGSIEGLEVRGSGSVIHTSKYANAAAKFVFVEPGLITRAQAYSGLSLNVIPTTKTIGRNPVTGNITYSVTYDNGPTNQITGSLSESITLTEQYPSDIFASIFVLGKTNGPVLQNLNTVTSRQRELAVEVVMNTAGSNSMFTGQPDYSALVTAAQPAGTVYIQNNVETWQPKEARGSKRITWVWV